jgi:hypothetical protein
MTDDEMRTLLADAVADVQPRRALADIRRRTARPRRRSLVWGVGGAAVATAATVAAVVALTHASGSGSAPAPAGQRASRGPVVLTYYAADAGPGLRLFPERHRTSSSSASLTDAVRDVVRGAPTVPDHRTLWPGGTSVRSVERRTGEIVVDLTGPAVVPLAPSRTARLALQQVVYTADQVTGTRLPVRFLVGGRASSTVLGEPASRPIAPAAVDATVAPVYVLTPGEGASVARSFTVTGRASAFEGTVQWELRKGDGTTTTGYTTTRECCRLSPYSFRVTAPPGSYTLTVHDEDVSDGEGTPVTRETRTLTVR